MLFKLQINHANYHVKQAYTIKLLQLIQKLFSVYLTVDIIVSTFFHMSQYIMPRKTRKQFQKYFI